MNRTTQEWADLEAFPSPHVANNVFAFFALQPAAPGSLLRKPIGSSYERGDCQSDGTMAYKCLLTFHNAPWCQNIKPNICTQNDPKGKFSTQGADGFLKLIEVGKFAANPSAKMTVAATQGTL